MELIRCHLFIDKSANMDTVRFLLVWRVYCFSSLCSLGIQIYNNLLSMFPNHIF